MKSIHVSCLVILATSCVFIQQSHCNDIVTEFQSVLDQVKALEKSGTKTINEMGDEVNDKKTAVGSFYWKELKTKFVDLIASMGSEGNAFIAEIKVKTNFSSESILKDISDLAEQTTSPHIVSNAEKVKTFLEHHKIEGDKLKELAETAESKLNLLNSKDEEIAALKDEVNNIVIEDPEVAKLKKTLHLLTRQIQNMQFNEEEKTRSDGNSGIKQIRTRYSGEKSYHSSSHTGRSFSAIHDHSNNKKICGMGEFIGVLNGVEFRTRHNDFSLRSAAHNDATYEKTEELTFPEVPPQVTSKTTVQAQIDEMVQWFKAFKEQDHSVRDYRKYFKPILCYLEGAWTRPKDSIDEPFESDRHSIDATSWYELQEKIRFTSYSGTKDLLENLAWLPTSIMGFDENDKPKLAQWNYRILCHPLKDDLPTSYLRPILDPHSQKMNGWNDEKFLNTRAVRFNMESVDVNGNWKDNPIRYSKLDELMEEIPGKNNYGANLPAAGFDADVLSAHPSKSGQKLNGAYYHRPYKLGQKDAMGTDTTQRGYSDRVYMAMTNQERIAGQQYTDADGNVQETKVSYAIPLEIIYLTPLTNWNPYKIKYEDDQTVTGSGTKTNPYSRSNRKLFFHTPASFFTGKAEVDAADTSQTDGVFIKNEAGDKVNTQASGVRIMFPKIAEIDGIIRQRYPIMPIYGEGNSIWKRINAFEDSLDGYKTSVTNDDVYYKVELSHKDDVTPHTHIIQISSKKIKEMKEDQTMRHTVSTTKAINHAHSLVLRVEAGGKLIVESCDGDPKKADGHICFDSHPILLAKDN